MHEAAYRWVAEKVAQFGPFEDVLEVGSRNINGTVRPLFGDAHYVGIDIVAGDGVDMVADALEVETLNVYDAIVCCEVFEHEPRWPLIVDRFADWLIPGGAVLATMAGPGRLPHSAQDGGPLHAGEWYANIDPFDLASVAGRSGLKIDIDDRNQGDLYAVMWRA